MSCTVYPIPYSIPSEYIVTDEYPMSKDQLWSAVIPGDRSNYVYNYTQEAEYYRQYQRSYFAKTCKKSGWDSLRHYEILANGCIPHFPGLRDCPKDTMCSFPKELLLEAEESLGLNGPTPNLEKYDYFRLRLLDWMRRYCTSEKTLAQRVIPHVKKDFKKVLLIGCQYRAEYSRELFWISMSRHLLKTSGSTLGEYVRVPFLFKGYPRERLQYLHGIGYCYSDKLDPEQFKESIQDEGEIVKKIESGFWDLIVYGIVSFVDNPGGVKELPLWNHVSKPGLYSRDQIVFVYGNDIYWAQDEKRYEDHLLQHLPFGTCFIREMCFDGNKHLKKLLGR